VAKPAELGAFYEGWANHHRLVVMALRDLTDDQVQLRPAPHQWAIWQLASHAAGARLYWLHDVLGEGDRATRDMFRVESTTVPGLPLEDAGWEDDENHPRTAPELVDAYERTWAVVQDCLDRWSAAELQVERSRQRRSGTQTFTRAWVLWHLLEHDLHHAGEISNILGSNGLPALDL
jgi:uncharacterized damage-inducible protein DinB